MLFAEQAEQAAVRILSESAAGRRRGSQQQYARGALLTGIILLVLRGPLENRLRNLQCLTILEVERSIHLKGQRSRIRDIFPHPQRYLRARYGSKPPGVIDKLHVQVYRHLARLAIASPIDVVAGAIGPQRKWTVDAGVGFRHDSVGGLLNVVKVAGFGPL